MVDPSSELPMHVDVARKVGSDIMCERGYWSVIIGMFYSAFVNAVNEYECACKQYVLIASSLLASQKHITL